MFVFFTTLADNSTAQTPFTKGNLAVYKIGNGTDSLSSAPFAVTIDEYTKAGLFVAGHPLPVTVNGKHKRIVSSGSATSEGQMSRSADKRFLIVTGYDTFPTPSRLSINNTDATIVNRVVGIIDVNGNINSTTALKDAYSFNNFRSAASTNGTDIWIGGTASANAQAGVRYTKIGADSSLRLSTNPTNIRVVNIFNGQLYCTTGSGAFKAISAVGNGTPVDSGQATTVLPGFPNTSSATADPYAFSISPQGNIAYVADGRSIASGGGIEKWELTSGTWNKAYTLNTGISNGIRHLVVDWESKAGGPDIYAITSEAIVKDKPGNKIVKVTDIGATSTFTELATAGSNYVFRGIAFAPENNIVSTTYTFTGNGNWSNATNWQNNTIPPNPLLSGTVIIDHITGGQCIVNTGISFSAGSSLIINTGKNLLVPGALSVQ